MTTPWISRPRWTCKYCNVTINDDVPSRTQHENGLRHKGNVERSLRDAYKKSERERAQDRANKHELDKIEKMAQKRHTEQDLASSSSSSQQLEASASSSATTTRKTPQWKPKDKLAAYGSALPTYAEEQATLDEKRQRQWQEKQDERQKAGMAGEWQTITPVRVSSATANTIVAHDAASHVPAAPSAPQTREKQGNYRSDDEQDGVGEIKVKKRTRAADEVERQRGMLPTWTPMRFDTGISAKQEGVQMVPVQRINDDRTEATVLDDDEPEEERKPLVAQSDPSDAPSASIFKKRKAGSGAGAKRVRAVI